MKKIILSIIASFLLLSLFSCGGAEEETKAPITSPGGISVNLPDTKVMYTESFTVTDKIASFQFNSIYERFKRQLDSSGTSPSDIGLLTGVSLKEQKCTVDEGVTWFEYFMNQAEFSLMEQLVLCEAAKAAGVELTEEDDAAIEKAISAIKKSAAAAGVAEADYVRAVYGEGVTFGDVRASLKLMYLAEKYLNFCIDAADVSYGSLVAVYEKNRDAIDVVSYLTYTFDSNEGQYANELSSCTSREDYLAYVKSHMTDVRGLGEADYEELMQNGLVSDNVYLDSTDTYNVWAAEASTGDVKQFTDGEGRITVVLVTAARGRNEAPDEDGTPAWQKDAITLIEAAACEAAERDAAKKYPVTMDREALFAIEG